MHLGPLVVAFMLMVVFAALAAAWADIQKGSVIVALGMTVCVPIIVGIGFVPEAVYARSILERALKRASAEPPSSAE